MSLVYVMLGLKHSVKKTKKLSYYEKNGKSAKLFCITNTKMTKLKNLEKSMG